MRRHAWPKSYWLDTSSNDIITEIVRDLPHNTVETLDCLLRDGRALVPMTSELGPYAQIRDRPETLYALLVSSGYLKAVSSEPEGDIPEGQAWVAIPNLEIEKAFVNDIVRKVRSNRESGEGRFDIALVPLVPDFPGVILEVKAADAETDDL